MADHARSSSLGEYAFMTGVILAILLGLFPSLDSEGLSTLFLALGTIVGLVNVTKPETHNFLLAALALLIVGTGGLDQLPALGGYFAPIFFNITSFVAPAVVIVGLKAVLDATRDQ
jgi:hypothetical protein